MVIVNNEKVKRLLVEHNPSWKGPDLGEYKDRAVYPGIWALIGEPQVVSLCGLRRVGKTSLMKMMIRDLAKKFPADSILYFSFDDFPGKELLDVIDAFEEMHGKKPHFLFFDEIQKVPNWAEKVKVLYDTSKCKIVVSGSESLFLLKGARESLAGRIFEFEIKGLTFGEYLDFAGKSAFAAKPGLYERELKAEFGKYLLTGGFPELVGKQDAGLVRQYIRTAVLEKIVFLDMARIYSIEDPSKLLSILEILISNPGMQVDYASLSFEQGISRQTISKYFDYLESAHLVSKLYNYSKNRSTSEKRLKKYYPTFLSPALAGEPGEAYEGKIIETACAIQTAARFFWRDKYKNEVDLVLLSDGLLLPVEVKYRANPRRGSGLEKFCKKYSCKEAIVVTRDARGASEDGYRTRLVPAYEFFLKGAKDYFRTASYSKTRK